MFTVVQYYMQVKETVQEQVPAKKTVQNSMQVGNYLQVMRTVKKHIPT